jgi:hypothetical protein
VEVVLRLGQVMLGSEAEIILSAVPTKLLVRMVYVVLVEAQQQVEKMAWDWALHGIGQPVARAPATDGARCSPARALYSDLNLFVLICITRPPLLFACFLPHLLAMAGIGEALARWKPDARLLPLVSMHQSSVKQTPGSRRD